MTDADPTPSTENSERPPAPRDPVVARCESIMAHAWMVRTFVKHAPEVEAFPELMEIARVIFDVSRALETRVDDPAGYLHLLKKKIGKLRKAADQFRRDAPLASDHTNFRQAVVSIDASVHELETILQSAVGPAPTSPIPAPATADPAADNSGFDVVVDIQEDQME